MLVEDSSWATLGGLSLIWYCFACVLLAKQSSGIIKSITEYLTGAADGKGVSSWGKECAYHALYIPRQFSSVVYGQFSTQRAFDRIECLWRAPF